MSRARSGANRNEILALVGYDAYISEIEDDLLYLVSVPDNVCARWLSISSSAAEKYIVFCIDDDPEFKYRPFLNDFGPNDLGTIHAFCTKIKIWLDTGPLRPDHTIIMLTSYSNQKQRLNATFMLCASAIVLLNKTPVQLRDCIEPTQSDINGRSQKGKKSFKSGTSSFIHYKDVFGGTNPFRLSLWNCVSAFYKAFKLKFYDYYEFDEAEYMFYEQVQNGDLNWILPGKLVAFSGPSSKSNCGRDYHPPEFYYDYFKRNNIKLIVRLNSIEYDAKSFEKMSFKHVDLFFPDGSAPTRSLAEEFLGLVEATDGAVAVHCQAGIGRTGTLIAAYIMKHYLFSAAEAIAWTRICRPGSVIGPQQNWLRLSQAWIHKERKSDPEMWARYSTRTIHRAGEELNPTQEGSKNARYYLRRPNGSVDRDPLTQFEGCVAEVDDDPIEWIVERQNFSEIFYPKTHPTRETNIAIDNGAKTKIDEVRRFEVNQARELLRSKLAIRKTTTKDDASDPDGESENLLNPLEWPQRTRDQVDMIAYEKSLQNGSLPLNLGKSMPRMIVTNKHKLNFVHKLAKTDVYNIGEIGDRRLWMTLSNDVSDRRPHATIHKFEIQREWPVKWPEGTFLNYRIDRLNANLDEYEIRKISGRYEILQMYSDLQEVLQSAEPKSLKNQH